MDFGTIFQLKTKKFWWMDVIFYFVISLLISTIFCYLIFLVKNNIQREDIKKEIAALETVGTQQQKDYEKDALNYQKKIIDFTDLLKNHEFASNVFAFMQAQTMPNIWFKQFSLDRKNTSLQLSGEADNLDAFSRQVASLEKNRYIKNITSLNSSLGSSSRIGFNMNVVLDQNIFGYVVDVAPLSKTTEVPTQPPAQEGQAATQTSAAKSNEKLITSFHLLLNPEVIGTIDETSHTITLNVPYNTDVKNLPTSMVISPAATVSPASGAPQDFENPVTYTVTAEDGSVQDYKVQVVVAAIPQVSQKSNKSGYVALIIVVLVIIALIAVGVSLFLRKKSKL